MANGPLPELLRDLGIETLLDDPETLHRMAEVALDRAGLAANGRAPEEYRLEIELFEWCTKRLALLAAEDSVLHRFASLRSGRMLAFASRHAFQAFTPLSRIATRSAFAM
jgi:hypothetical protein